MQEALAALGLALKQHLTKHTVHPFDCYFVFIVVRNGIWIIAAKRLSVLMVRHNGEEGVFHDLGVAENISL